MGEKLEGRTLFDIEQGGVNGTRASVAILGWGVGQITPLVSWPNRRGCLA
jgi:hypothetical protein